MYTFIYIYICLDSFVSYFLGQVYDVRCMFTGTCKKNSLVALPLGIGCQLSFFFRPFQDPVVPAYRISMSGVHSV